MLAVIWPFNFHVFIITFFQQNKKILFIIFTLWKLAFVACVFEIGKKKEEREH